VGIDIHVDIDSQRDEPMDEPAGQERQEAKILNFFAISVLLIGGAAVFQIGSRTSRRKEKKTHARFSFPFPIRGFLPVNAGECKLQSCPLAAGRRGLGGKPQTPKQQAPLAREGGANGKQGPPPSFFSFPPRVFYVLVFSRARAIFSREASICFLFLKLASCCKCALVPSSPLLS
jgi:hypothetical protein